MAGIITIHIYRVIDSSHSTASMESHMISTIPKALAVVYVRVQAFPRAVEKLSTWYRSRFNF